MNRRNFLGAFIGMLVAPFLSGVASPDAVSREAFYRNGLKSGWLSVKDIRRLEDLQPVMHIPQGGFLHVGGLISGKAGVALIRPEHAAVLEPGDIVRIGSALLPVRVVTIRICRILDNCMQEWVPMTWESA